MEQQSQQPIQEKIEIKPPIKTNWKFIGIVVVLALFAVGGILLLRQIMPAPSPTVYPTVNIQTLEGMLRFTNLEGGCWYLEVRIPPKDPVRGFPGLAKYEIYGLSKTQLEYYQDQQVKVKGRIHEDVASICQIGTIFEVEKIFPPEGDNKQSITDTSDWQTYRNSEFGFEMRYPDGWVVEEYDLTTESVADANHVDFSDDTDSNLTYTYRFGFIVYPNPNDIQLRDYLVQEKVNVLYPLIVDPEPTREKRQRLVASMQATRFQGYGALQDQQNTKLFVSIGQYVFMLYMDSLKGGVRSFTDAPFNQILSTFRFVE